MFLAEEGLWQWSNTVHDLDDDRTMTLLDTVLHAATNTGEPVFGSHCSNCWGRLHCPEFLLPAALGETELGALAKTGPGELDGAGALKALLFYERVKSMLPRVKDTLEAFATRNGGIYDPDAKKYWAPVQSHGRESCNVARLRDGLGQEAEKYISQGAPYNQMRWVKKPR